MNYEQFFEITIYCFCGVVLLLLLFWKFYFLRDPNRKITAGNNLISPADGKILEILKFDVSKKDLGLTEIKKGNLGKIRTTLKDVTQKGYIVSIFMSPLDVHVNRAPLQGKIIYQKHVKGKFHVAYDFWKSLENEKNEIVIEGKIRVKMIQIAGMLAKRIESFVKVGDRVVKGQRVGLINLGSQVTLIFSDKLNLAVKTGEIVKAGESIIAKF